MVNIVIDTNVIVAAFLSRSGRSHQILQQIRRNQTAWHYHLSAPLVFEYEEVLMRELPPDKFPRKRIREFLDDFISEGIRHRSIPRRRPISRDPDDDAVIELALFSKVDCIVTFNTRDFKPVEPLGVRVLTPMEFAAEYIT